MTKRDSHVAELPSPRALTMAARDLEMPDAAIHSYTTPTTPGPEHHPLATSSTASSHQPSTQIPPLPLPLTRHYDRPLQRMAHSIVFKILERPLHTGGFSRELMAEETNTQGYTQPKNLEFFFNGIIGHLRDRWGYTLDNDRLCSQLANYWRSWFGVPTLGPVFDYSDPVPWPSSEGETTIVPLAESQPLVTGADTAIPTPILQTGWLLHTLVETFKDEHPALDRLISQTRPGTLRDLRSDQIDHEALSNLCVSLGILASQLSRDHTTNLEIHAPDDEEDGL